MRIIRLGNAASIAVVPKSINQKNKRFIAVYGQEQIEPRMDDSKFMDDLRVAYGDWSIPTFLMHVWGDMTFEYNIVIAESIRRMLQAFPKSARRGRLKERSLIPLKDGTTVWNPPTKFQMGSSLGFWKSRAPPGLDRWMGRGSLHCATPIDMGGKIGWIG